MPIAVTPSAEIAFLVLPRAEREAIIGYGATLRLAGLRKREFLAQSKVRHFEEKYGATLSQLEMEGLPDDAGFEMHEDFIMWHHWQDVLVTIGQDITRLETIAGHGLTLADLSDVGG